MMTLKVTYYDVMEEEEMLDDDSSLYVSAVHKEALLRTDKYINHQNPHQDHYQGKEKVLMTPIPDKRLATGAPRFPLKGNSLISTPESSQSGDHQPATWGIF